MNPAAVTVEILRPPISTDGPLPGVQWLMESSGAPPPTDTARLVTPDGLVRRAGSRRRRLPWTHPGSLEARNSLQEWLASSTPVAHRGKKQIGEDEDARALDVLWTCLNRCKSSSLLLQLRDHRPLSTR